MNEKNQRILIVDDESSIRRILQQGLSTAGYQCEQAGDAREAMEKLREHEADLAILDIKMPGKSGMELLPELKAEHPDTMVIMASALFDNQTAIQCMKLGAYDYFTKPFNIDEVLISVNRALEKKQLEVEVKDYHRNLELKVTEQAEKIRRSFFNAVMALALALEAKDKYTRGHSERVSRISAIIAKEMKLPKADIEKIKLAGLIHDIGKIGVREVILNKPDELTAEEYQHVMSHSEIGERILSPVVEDPEILEMVRHHHEHYDGSGYPDGLSGQSSPSGKSNSERVLSRNVKILAAADAYDAMTSDRSYRNALTPQEAMMEIKRGSGKQFDPEIVEAFLKAGDTIAKAI